MTQPCRCASWRVCIVSAALGIGILMGAGTKAGEDNGPPAKELSDALKDRVIKLVQRSKDSADWKTRLAAEKLATDVAAKPREYPVFLQGLPDSSDRTYILKVWAVEYRYNGTKPGITVRRKVGLGRDQANDRVLDVEFLRNYPTPLADEEKQEAIQLARKKVSAVEDAFKNHGTDVEVTRTVTIFANPDHPRFGHRLVRLSFYTGEGGQAAARVLVDLTTGEVEAAASSD